MKGSLILAYLMTVPVLDWIILNFRKHFLNIEAAAWEPEIFITIDFNVVVEASKYIFGWRWELHNVESVLPAICLFLRISNIVQRYLPTIKRSLTSSLIFHVRFWLRLLQFGEVLEVGAAFWSPHL